jgi:hypothetical protein
VVGEDLRNILAHLIVVVLVEEMMVICRMIPKPPFIQIQSIQEQVVEVVAVLVIIINIPQEEILDVSLSHIPPDKYLKI